MSNARIKLAKNQEKAEQHHEIEVLLFENYSLSSSTLSSMSNNYTIHNNENEAENETEIT